MNYYNRFPGDYQRDTGHLSLMEHGVYALLLDHYYSVRKPLPAKLGVLYRICRAVQKPEQDAVDAVADEFFPMAQDGLRHNRRADSEISKWETRAAHNREVGKKGGRPKSNPDDNPDGNPSGNPSDNPDVNPNTNPEQTNMGQKSPVLETREKPSPSPSPTPTPEANSNTKISALRAQEAREPGDEGRAGAETFGNVSEFQAQRYRDAIQSAYPKGGNDSDWLAALKQACAIVDHGWRTWAELLADTERYAHYVANGGVSAGMYILAAHNFFEVRVQGPWSRDWRPPDGRAERRLASNVSVLQDFVAGAKP